MGSRKYWGAIVVLVVACSFSTNCGLLLYMNFQNINPNESLLERVIRTGELRLGTSPDYPPFESLKDTGSGLEVVGFDIELAKEIVNELSDRLGIEVKLRIEAAFFNALMAGLNSDAYDIVIAAFAIRPYREKEVDFSIPYYFSRQCCIVADSDDSITNETDLEGKIIAVQRGTSGEEIAGGFNAQEVKSLPTVDNIIVEIVNGDSDAAIIDLPVAEYLAQAGDIKVAFNMTAENLEGFGVAMKEGEGVSEIMFTINNTITFLNQSGELETIFQNIT